MSEIVPIKKIFNFEKGSLQSTKCTSGVYTFVTAGSDWKTHNEFTHDTEALIVAVAASGSLGRCHYIKDKFIASDLCFILTPKDAELYPVDLEFYHQIFRSIKNDLVQKTATGTSKLSINRTNFGNYKISYFDIEHQKVFKKILHNVNNKKDKLLVCGDNQENLVKLLRGQILQDAISGKLTADWRRKNTDIEPASKLLEKIKAEKEKLIAEKKIKREKPLPKITEDEVSFELPEKWEWCRLGGVVQHNSGKTLDSGRNTGELKEYITTSNLYWGFFNLDKVKKMPIKASELEKCVATKGDLLICEGGEAGRSAIWKEDYDICFQNHIHRARPYCSVSNSYIFWFFQKINFSGEINKHRKGMGISNLSGKSLSLIPIPLPPQAEQKAIVAKVEKLMSYVSELEEKIKQNKRDSEMLMQSFLVEAFKN